MTNATLTPSSIGSSASASPTRDSLLNINASAKESKLAFYNVGEHEGHALVPQRRSAALPVEIQSEQYATVEKLHVKFRIFYVKFDARRRNISCRS